MEYADVLYFEDHDGDEESGKEIIREWQECSECKCKLNGYFKKCPNCNRILNWR